MTVRIPALSISLFMAGLSSLPIAANADQLQDLFEVHAGYRVSERDGPPAVPDGFRSRPATHHDAQRRVGKYFAAPERTSAQALPRRSGMRSEDGS